MSRNSNKKRKERMKKKQKERRRKEAAPRLESQLSGFIQFLCEFISHNIQMNLTPPPGSLKEITDDLKGQENLHQVWQLVLNFLGYTIDGKPMASHDLTFFLSLQPFFRSIGKEKVFFAIKAACADTVFDPSDLRHVGAPLRVGLLMEKALSSNEDIARNHWDIFLHCINGAKQIRKELLAFLSLKRPKPELKSAKNLDAALKRHPLDSESSLCLGSIMRLFLAKKSSTSLEDWSDLSSFYHLATYKKVPINYTFDFNGKNDPKVGLLVEEASSLNMPSFSYKECLKVLVAKVRIALYYYNGSKEDISRFEESLHVLLQFLTRGVPSSEAHLASRSLDHLCDWLEEGFSSEDLTIGENNARLLQGVKKKDYRAAIFLWLESEGKAAASLKVPETGWQHVSFNFFRKGLSNTPVDNSLFKKLFFDSLSAEGKKDLIIKSCERLLVKAQRGKKMQSSFGFFANRLLRPKEEPVASVLQGRASEGDFLFYVAYAMARKDQIDWLDRAQYEKILRFLTKKAHNIHPLCAIELFGKLLNRFPKESAEHFDIIAQIADDYLKSDLYGDDFDDLLFDDDQDDSDNCPQIVHFLKALKKFEHLKTVKKAGRLIATAKEHGFIL